MCIHRQFSIFYPNRIDCFRKCSSSIKWKQKIYNKQKNNQPNGSHDNIGNFKIWSYCGNTKEMPKSQKQSLVSNNKFWVPIFLRFLSYSSIQFSAQHQTFLNNLLCISQRHTFSLCAFRFVWWLSFLFFFFVYRANQIKIVAGSLSFHKWSKWFSLSIRIDSKPYQLLFPCLAIKSILFYFVAVDDLIVIVLALKMLSSYEAHEN